MLNPSYQRVIDMAFPWPTRIATSKHPEPQSAAGERELKRSVISRYAPRMKEGCSKPLRAVWAVGLVFAGVWLGHVLEYLRVGGVRGLHQAVLGSAHLYMLPVGVVLAALAARFGLRWWRLWTSLGRHLDRERSRLRSGWRARPPGSGASSTPRIESGLSVPLVWPPLALAQIGVYLLQENLEALLSGQQAPGLDAVSGIHWAAPLVHGAVALVAAVAVAFVTRRLHGRASSLRRCHRLVQLLWRLRRFQTRVTRGPADWPRSPVERFGPLRWSRPPPALSAAPS